MKNTLLQIAGIAFLSIQMGCALDSSETDKSDQADYAAEKKRIKSTVTTQAMLDQRVAALQTKHGIRLDAPLVIPGWNQPDMAKPAVATEEAPAVPKPVLPKGAAFEYDIFAVKSATSVPIERPYYEAFTIGAGEAITASVTATQGGVDPFLVVYEIVEGSLYEYKSQQKLDVLAWNDDYSGLNPQVSTWTFPSAKNVVVLVFAYDQNSKGYANATITIGSTTYTRDGIAVRGKAIFHDDATYISKSGQLTDVYGNGWSRYLPGTTGFSSADVWNNEYNWGSYRPSCTGDTYLWAFNMSEYRGMANDDSIEGYCSGMLNDGTWSSFPDSYHYPSFVLLGGYSDGGTMNFLQLSGFYK